MKDAGQSNVVPLRDGLISLVSGMGTTTDPRSYQGYIKRWMSDYEIEQAYRGSWLMRRVVDQPATECVREWRDWQAEKDVIGALEKEERRLDVRGHVRMGLTLGGLGGGATIVYMDGDQTQPADPQRIGLGGIVRLQTWHRSRFSLGPMITDWADSYFGYPSYYEVQLTGGTSTSIKFHPSRVIEWKGRAAPYIAASDWVRSFWGDSDVEVVIDAVQNVDASQNGFAALIKDARNRRIYIPRLLEMVATANGEAQLAKRLQAFALGESSNSVSWLDGGDGDGKGAEKIEDRQMNWAGMKDILTAYLDAAAAAADRPATVLLGKSPDGMNASGTSDLAIWEKTIKGKQDLDVRPRIDRLDQFLIPSALGRQDDTIWYSWAPLSTQSEKDEATTFWNTMQALDILAGLNLIPDIALSKATQTLLSERGWMPGLDDALSEIPENERFPELEQPGSQTEDPSAITQPSAKGGDPASAVDPAGGNAGRRRAANDALKARGLDDAAIVKVLDAVFGAEGEQSRPFGDGSSDQPRDEHGRWTNGASHVFIRHAASGHAVQRAHVLGEVGADLSTKLAHHGIDGTGKTITLEHGRVRHILAEHSGPAETGRGQKPITHGDLAAAHDLLNSASSVKIGHPPIGKQGHTRFEATTSHGGTNYTIVGETRKRAVTIVSMWKR